MVRCARLLASISRSVGRRFAGAMTLALASSLSLGGVATAAPAATTSAPAAAAPADPKAAKQAWKAAKKEARRAKKAERKAKKQAKKDAKRGKSGAPAGTSAAATTTTAPAGGSTTAPPTGAATTAATGEATTTAATGEATTTAATAATTAPPPADAGPKPAPTSEGLVLLPMQVEGSLSKDSRRTLAERLQAAVAAAKVSGGPYRARLEVRVSKKKGYGLTLAVLGADDATLATHTDECKGCSLEQVGARIDALVQQAATGLAPKEPPPPATAAVSVRTEPLGARVRVDGAEQGFSPQALELSPGEHTIAVDKPGFLPQEQKLTVEAGAPQELDVVLVAEPPAKGKGSKRAKAAKAPKQPTGPADPRAGRGYKIAGLTLLGLGIAGVATGVAMILIDEDPMPLKCSGADVDFRGVCRYRYDTLVGGIVGVGAGALGIGGGIALMVKGRQVSLRAGASKQSASLRLVVRF